MAKSLNRSRIMLSKVIGLLTLFIVLFTAPLILPESAVHESLDYLGLMMVSVCALGRVYCTAYLGGSKNESLINYGPFSVVRNPLYVFSFIGFSGIALMSNHILIILFVPLAFAALYKKLISREEAFLSEKFGTQYASYREKVHAVIPNFSNWEDKDDIVINTKLFRKGLLDAIWWFAALPLVEVAEYLQDHQWVNPAVMIP